MDGLTGKQYDYSQEFNGRGRFVRDDDGACTDAGLDDVRFHDLRHKAGSRLADAGADAFTIAEILGHGTLQMTKRYTHATDERKRRAVEALTGRGKNIVTRLSQSKSGDRVAAAK